MKINTQGILYVVSTPLGNRQDMTLRAIETLKNVDVIAAEDTRHSLPLLQHFSINTPMLALHDHNEREQAETLIGRLNQGESIALISDAGTPLISDPGYHLVQAVREAGVRIVPIPGACAAIAALSVAGLATDRFVFEGFLPAKTQARVQRLQGLSNEQRTMIFYEAPHRIKDLLDDLQKVFGDDRVVVLARELTKVYETIRSGKVAELIEWVASDPNQQRGEMVVMVAGAEKSAEQIESASTDEILELLLSELTVKKAAELAAKITNKRKNELYQRALELKKPN
jgi:16S rRNA (cytidine1402-2'-O)-methyltransferase